MSKESVQKFYELLRQDAAVVEELKATVEGVESTEKATDILINFAKTKGFDFTVDDILAFEAEAQKELTIEELDKIHGGVWGFCMIFGIGWGGDAEGDYGAETHCWGFGLGVGPTNREYTGYEKKVEKK